MHYVLIGYPRSGTYTVWEILQTLLPEHCPYDLSGGPRHAPWPDLGATSTLIRHHFVDQLDSLTPEQIETMTVVTTVRRNFWDMCVSKCLADATGVWQGHPEWPTPSPPDPVTVDRQFLYDQAYDYQTWCNDFVQVMKHLRIRVRAIDFDMLTTSTDPVQQVASLLDLPATHGPAKCFDQYRMPWRPRDLVQNYDELEAEFLQHYPRPWRTHWDLLDHINQPGVSHEHPIPRTYL